MPPSIAVSSIFMSSISNRGKSISIHPANCGPHDNHTRGTVAELPAELIKDEASHALVSAYFTIQANEAMRRQLDGMRHMRFLFGEPWFIRNRDPDKTDKKAFDIGDAGLQLKNRLEKRRIAADCATWCKKHVEIRFVRHPISYTANSTTSIIRPLQKLSCKFKLHGQRIGTC